MLETFNTFNTFAGVSGVSSLFRRKCFNGTTAILNGTPSNDQTTKRPNDQTRLGELRRQAGHYHAADSACTTLCNARFSALAGNWLGIFHRPAMSLLNSRQKQAIASKVSKVSKVPGIFPVFSRNHLSPARGM